MFKLAARNLLRQRLRTSLTLSAIAFGVAVLILMGGFVEDVFRNLRDATIHSQLGHVQIYRAGYYEHGRREPYGYMIERDADVLAAARALPAVRAAMRRLSFTGLMSNGTADLPVLGEGVEPGPEAMLGTSLTVVAGRLLRPDDVNSALVGEGVAAALRLRPGDYVNLNAVTPGGAVNLLEYQVVGVFRSVSKEYDAHAVRLPLPAARELLNTPAVHSVVLLLADDARTGEVARALRARLGKEYEVKTWWQLADFYQKTVDLYHRQYAVLEFITLAMVVLGVANTIGMTVYERTGEYGTLLAIGTRRRRIYALVMLEQVLLGLAGAAAGALLGMVLAKLISVVGIPMPPPPNMNQGYLARIPVMPEAVATAVLIGWAATVLAALLPARRAARLEIVAALRRNV